MHPSSYSSFSDTTSAVSGTAFVLVKAAAKTADFLDEEDTAAADMDATTKNTAVKAMALAVAASVGDRCIRERSGHLGLLVCGGGHATRSELARAPGDVGGDVCDLLLGTAADVARCARQLRSAQRHRASEARRVCRPRRPWASTGPPRSLDVHRRGDGDHGLGLRRQMRSVSAAWSVAMRTRLEEGVAVEGMEEDQAQAAAAWVRRSASSGWAWSSGWRSPRRGRRPGTAGRCGSGGPLPRQEDEDGGHVREDEQQEHDPRHPRHRLPLLPGLLGVGLAGEEEGRAAAAGSPWSLVPRSSVRRTAEVLNLVPKEQALARVHRCVGGGAETNNADSDSDIEVVADSVSVNLRCPVSTLMTASRIQIAGRFKPCAHKGCFDLEAFIEINHRLRKWQCPICLKNYSLENIIIDPYFNRITSLIKSCRDDTSEIDIKPNGSWRVKGRSYTVASSRWYSVWPHMQQPSPKPGNKKKNSNGQWEISRRGDTDLVLFSDNEHVNHIENKSCITLSNNIDDTNNGEEGCNLKLERNDSPMSHVHDLDSSASDENAPPASTEQDIIALSDLDDDAVMVLSPSAVNCGSTHDAGNLFHPSPPEISREQPGGCSNETSFHALKEGFGDLGLSFWECLLSPRDDLTYQVFDTSTLVTDNQGEEENYSPNHIPNHGSVSGGWALQLCTSNERDCATGLANLSDGTQTCVDGHFDELTDVSISGTDEGLINGRNAFQKRRNLGDGISALDASVDDEMGGERCCGRPLSLPQQQCSVRPRLLLTIDLDSD
ncbi:hypothetical protein U9M48_035315 [Paspalum notatum var. saurae]|uniref:SP-RING-type domain-containing protein n=1 Tax=Paspalum notatum var. saurae TaxID=547442 RepID=A0AAQ3UF71_PASNO